MIATALCASLFLSHEVFGRLAGVITIAVVALGLTRQAWKHYIEGVVGVHWMLNGLMMATLTFRGIYMFLEKHDVIAIPDFFGSFVTLVIHFQICGYFLKKRTLPDKQA